MRAKNIGVYIHIPFCIKKCDYCDFISYPNLNKVKDYVKALLLEIELKSHSINNPNSLDKESQDKKYIVSSIYIGGGTPNLLDTSDINSILCECKEHLTVAEDAELSIELNPCKMSKSYLAELNNIGINRISIGIQSLDDSLLNILGRRHNSETARQTLIWGLETGFDSVNVDLIYGIPTQTMKVWKDTLQEICLLKPEHISLYSLAIESPTPIYDKIQKGAIMPLADDEVADMYEEGFYVLFSNGYSRYEISNFSLPSMQCRHNLGYWQLNEYIGFGVSSHSYFDGYRYRNNTSLERYLENAINRDWMQFDKEYQDEKTMAMYLLILGLRLDVGIDLAHIQNMMGIDIMKHYGDKISLLLNNNMLVLDRDRIKLAEGFTFISNTILQEFV